MNEIEISNMLHKIFPPKPSPEPSKLTPAMELIIERARELGLSDIPPVVLENMGKKCSCVDFNTFDQTVICINTVNMFDGSLRSIEQIERSLAHELGHLFHLEAGLHYGNAGFKWCEDRADEVKNILLQKEQKQ